MVSREHVHHIEGCQFITEIHILKVRLKMSELLIFSPFFNLNLFFLFTHLFSYLFIIIIIIIIIVCFSIFITLCLDLVVEKKKPLASLTVLQFVEGINMKKQM